jgi:pimeloyl-ACP methyl ester carboxylesterase
MRKNVWSLGLGVFLIALFGLFSTAAAQNSYTVNFQVQLRDNVSVEMGAIVLTNPDSPPNGSTILTLNGTGQTASTFRPLGETLFSDRTGSKVSRMILLNYPGHGNSGLPTGILFGELSINDYVTSLIESLDKLSQMNLSPDTLLGHSLGAEIIQMAQTRLISQGTNLRTRFGIRSAIFLVPDLAAPLPWLFVDSGAAGPLVSQFVRVDPVLGPVLDIPPPVWVALFYSDRANNVIPNATTPAEAVANGYISLDSATMGAELIGATGSRPFISEGSFAPQNGTVAGLVALEQDGLYLFPDEHLNLYNYVTQDQSGKLFFPITGANTVHNIHVVSPEIFVPAIKKILNASKN